MMMRAFISLLRGSRRPRTVVIPTAYSCHEIYICEYPSLEAGRKHLASTTLATGNDAFAFRAFSTTTESDTAAVQPPKRARRSVVDRRNMTVGQKIAATVRDKRKAREERRRVMIEERTRVFSVYFRDRQHAQVTPTEEGNESRSLPVASREEIHDANAFIDKIKEQYSPSWMPFSPYASLLTSEPMTCVDSGEVAPASLLLRFVTAREKEENYEMIVVDPGNERGGVGAYVACHRPVLERILRERQLQHVLKCDYIRPDTCDVVEERLKEQLVKDIFEVLNSKIPLITVTTRQDIATQRQSFAVKLTDRPQLIPPVVKKAQPSLHGRRLSYILPFSRSGRQQAEQAIEKLRAREQLAAFHQVPVLDIIPKDVALVLEHYVLKCWHKQGMLTQSELEGTLDKLKSEHIQYMAFYHSIQSVPVLESATRLSIY